MLSTVTNGESATFTSAKTIAVDNAVTNAVTTILTLGHNTTGTGAASIGAGLSFQTETTTTPDTPLAEINASWSTATHASRSGQLILGAYYTTTFRSAVTIVAGSARATTTFSGTTSNPGNGGLRNEAWGAGAGVALTTNGNDNVVIGSTAGAAITTGTNNIAIGSAAFDAASTATNCIAIGYNALGAYTTGTGKSIAIGTSAALLLTGNADTIAIGYESMSAQTSNTGHNTCLGHQTGKATSNSIGATIIGYQAGDTGNIGNLNVIIGEKAGRSATGTENVIIGYNAATNASNSMASSTAIGRESLYSCNSATTNTCVGAYSGRVLTSGTRNTYVGYGIAITGVTTASRQIALGDNCLPGNTNDIIVIGTDGIGFGNTKEAIIHIGQSAGEAPTFVLSGRSSVQARQTAAIVSSFVVNTDASRTCRATFGAYDTAFREAVRVEASGSASMLGFHGSAAVTKPTISGSRANTEQALKDLLTALANYGLITDSTTT